MVSRISVIVLIIATLLMGGNVADANTFTVSQTILSNDSTPPSIPTGVTATAIAATQIDLSWTASTDNIAVAGYEITRDGVAIATVTAPQVAYSDATLAASTTYSYTLRAFDSSLNYSTSSATATATTFPPPPVIAPTTTVSATTSNTHTQAHLTLDSLHVSASPGIDQVGLLVESPVPIRIKVTWGKTSDANEGTLTSPLYFISHTSLISGLHPETKYWIIVEATDAYGATIVKTIEVTTTKDIKDTIPTNPSEFTGVMQEDGIHLTWKNPNESQFSEVRIIRKTGEVATDPFDGTPVYEGGDQAFIDSTVAEGTIYGYTIFARTKDGQFSSGAVVVVRSFSKDTIGDAHVVVIPPNQNDVGTTTDWLLSGLTMTQGGVEEKAVNKIFTITDDAPFTLSLSSDGMPRVLKTIIVTMRDPEHFERTFSFLLRLNTDGSAYEARIGALGKEGRFETMLALLDVKTQAVESTSFTIAAIKGQNTEALKTTHAQQEERNTVVYFGLLAFALIIIMSLLLFLGKKRRTEE